MGKARGPPGFDIERVAVLELPHVELADGGPLEAAVRDAVDHRGAHAADPLAAVVVERDGLLPLADQVLVDDVEHLEEGMVGGDVPRDVGLEPSGVARVPLPPHDQLQVHGPAPGVLRGDHL
jgi:hypothetical protein